jgi:tetratricopeptide (TPR) repeat protein
MRKVLVTFVLALTGAALAQGSSQQPATSGSQQPAAGSSQQPATAPSDQSNVPTSQKVIKDPAEYNAYMTALNTQDPAQRAAAMEAFVKQYPQSIVLSDALEQAMAGYQAATNQTQDPAQKTAYQGKVVETAKQILKVLPNNISALAIVTAIDRSVAMAGGPTAAAALTEGCGYAQTGLKELPTWQKPAGMDDPTFAKLKDQVADIFNGTAGFCALQNKDYVGARPYYQKAVQLDPTNMQDTYYLALSYLEATPVDLNGFWYAGKAINLAKAQKNDPAAQGIANYVKAKYRRYHGTPDGFDEFVASTANQTAPPSQAELDKAIPPKPTDCDIAADVVAKNDPGTLSFSDWEFILAQRDCGPKGKEAADKVWQTIQDKQKGGEAKLKIPEVMVIASASDSVDVAITDDNKAAKKADMHVALEKPVTRPPAAGTTTDIIGVLSSYTPNPFMFTMTHGELPAAKPPARKPTPTHRPGAGRK